VYWIATKSCKMTSTMTSMVSYQRCYKNCTRCFLAKCSVYKNSSGFFLISNLLKHEMDSIWNKWSRVINISCDNLLRNRPFENESVQNKKNWFLSCTGCAPGQAVLRHGSRDEWRRLHPRVPGTHQTGVLLRHRRLQQGGKQ